MEVLRATNTISGTFERVGLAVTGYNNPSERDWECLWRAFEAARCTRVIAYSGSSKALSSEAKRCAFDTFKRLRITTGTVPTFALVLQRQPELIVKFTNAAIALNRHNVRMAMYNPSQIETALASLALSHTQLATVRRYMDEWSSELRVGNNLFSLPAEWNTRV